MSLSKNIYLGIDTSCYTTSLAAFDASSALILDKRKPLEVKKGNRGLRQSEAVFQHIKNLPELFSNVSNEIDISRVKKIAVSSCPRRIEGSYMPVFLAGVSYGKSIASILNVEYEEYSHQEGHIEAGRWSSASINNNSFLSVHISGGTTEMLSVVKNTRGYDSSIIGRSLDISAGQLIDRIGVMMGLSFPAGKELDEISKGGQAGRVSLPVSTKGSFVNYSGVETYTQRLIQSGKEKHKDIAIALLKAISDSLYSIIINSSNETQLKDVLLIGGVASNTFIRNNLKLELNKAGVRLHIGMPEYCTDNAVGTALLGIK